MRTFILFIALLGLSSLSAQTTKEVDSKITDVVVYLQGAQVTRQATADLPAGKSDLLFKGITARLNPNSLQVAAGKGITILSVNHSTDYMQPAKTNGRIDVLVEQRDDLQDSIQLIRSTREVSIKEREMLLKNQSIGGQESGVNVEQLIRATDFFRNRLTEIEKTLFGMQRNINDMQKRLDKINRQLNELNAQNDIATSTIKVSVTANQRVNVPLQMSYTVSQARWQPFYDIRVEDTNDPVNLVYKAKVYQNTDETWDNVNLTLSTGNPSISNYKPELQPWFVDYQQSRLDGSFMMEDTEMMEFDEVMVVEDSKAQPIRAKKSRALGRENVTITQQQTTTAFQIKIPYTIPHDNQGYDVSVMNHEIASDYQYATVPKLASHVYLLARITDWSNLNLLPGDANIYFDQTYQGKTHLDPYTSEDTLSVSIGRDPGIIVTRELQKDYSSNSLFGNNRKETKSWKIAVRNSKNTPANVFVEDQYPVSSNSDIKVELEESSNANVNPVTGQLNWNLELAPGERRELRLVYSVRYPKDQNVMVH